MGSEYAFGEGLADSPVAGLDKAGRVASNPADICLWKLRCLWNSWLYHCDAILAFVGRKSKIKSRWKDKFI